MSITQLTQLINTTIHIKMKRVNVKSSTYINFNKENNKEDPKFEVGDHVRIPKYKNTFAKRYIPKFFKLRKN